MSTSAEVKHASMCQDHDVDHELGESEPIAVVGMALRLPGGVNSPEQFWEFLLDKKDGLCEVPQSRYKLDSFYKEGKPGTVRTRKGYFLQDDPALFDADFFSISPYEAERMDPQQRQLLEVVWECLENAGESNWRGKEVGCFVGVYGEDWIDLNSKDPQAVDRYHVLGTGQFALANRVSYELDFQGPSMTLQTGCSSSLVGLHEACQALNSRECSSAIVAGTNLIFTPTMTTTMSENLVLSPSGSCKTFDAKADGYGRGEAINAIYIKRLGDAIRDNDNIRGVIRATSTNCDGKTMGITTPGSLSQERLVRKAYQKAHIRDISQTAFFECHGTGTTVGDQAETSVVAKLFQHSGVLIGAVKPNVGHSEGASGITSVIKAILSLENRVIPPNIFFDEPNPNIPFKEAGLQVPIEATPWPEGRSERISVNCFGIGGSNAHAILDSAGGYVELNQEARLQDTAKNSHTLLVASAHSSESLQKRIRDLVHYVNQHPDRLHDLAYSLNMRRDHLKNRAFAVVKKNQPTEPSNFKISQVESVSLSFVFTGQGAQWEGMGRDLIQTYESFANDMRELDFVLQGLDDSPSWSLVDELMKTGKESRVNEAEFSQPLCTALQIGLVNLLRRWGVHPTALAGHSSGEIAAAYASGAISAKSALIIAYFRGKVVQTRAKAGSMAAIGLGSHEITPLLQTGVQIACENSPKSVTVSGDPEVVNRLVERVRQDFPDALCKILKIHVAYHSRHMHEIGAIYESKINSHLEHGDVMLPVFSSVTGEIIRCPQTLNSAYWRSNLESTVLFAGAIKSIIKKTKGTHVFLEIGPHSALAAPLRQIFDGTEQASIYVPTLTRGAEDTKYQMLQALGHLHANGAHVAFQKLQGTGNLLTDLPAYPWDHSTRYWHESRLAFDWRQREFPHHEILGARVVESSDIEPSWRNILTLGNVPWLWDHVLQANVVFPAAGYICMAGEAVRQLNPDVEDYSIRNLALRSPLILTDEESVEIITTIKPVKYTDLTDSVWYAVTIMAYDGTGWTKHCQAEVRSGTNFASSPVQQIPGNIRPVDSEKWYRALDRQGLSYGKMFRGLDHIFTHPVELRANATVTNKIECELSRYTLHPTVIDQCLQLMSVALTNGNSRRIDRLAIPAAVGYLHVRGHASQMDLGVQMTKNESGNLIGSADLIADSKPLLSLTQALFFHIQESSSLDSTIPLTSQIKWAPEMDLMAPKSWLAPANASDIDLRSSELMGKAAMLYIMETADRIADCVPASPALHRYKSWICSQNERISSGKYSKFTDWQSWTQMKSEDRIRAISGIEGQTEGVLPLISGLRKVLENCRDIITGKIPAVHLLMEDNILERIYDLGNKWCTWSRPLELFSHANPNARILEIGAGTGSSTKKALSSLVSPEGVCYYSKYIFTDVSAGFVVAAKEKFTSFKNLEFKTLDITQDLKEQEVEIGCFDLVIASNVLHATPSLQATLRNVRELLSPNGKLLLQELSPEYLTIDLIMGGLAGWWVGESDGRSEKPYVSPSRWDKELRTAGFTGSDVFHYDLPQPLQFNFIMMSSVSIPSISRRKVLLLSNKQSMSWDYQVAETFCENGHEVNWGRFDSEPPIDHDIVVLLDMDLENPYLYHMDEARFSALQDYLRKVKTRVLWLTPAIQFSCGDPRSGLILGLARTLRHEMLLDISTVELDKFDVSSALAVFQIYTEISRKREIKDLEPEYEFALEDDLVHVGRCHWGNLPGKQDPPHSSEEAIIKLDIGSYGILDTLGWRRIESCAPTEDEVEIDIRYIGLNFRDIMVSMGLVGNKSELGIEASGTVRRVGANVTDLSPGDSVSLINCGVLQNRFVAKRKYCRKLRSGFSPKDAATMTAVFATAMYSLIDLGALKKGQSVLIHSACGGVGLAAIQICHVIGAEVFATVGSEEKILYLVDHIGIPRNHIFNSRSAEFLPDILRETNGRGVDIVINSLAGELLHASWECVASRGKMIELGKRDLLTNGVLSLTPFSKNRSFIGVDLLQLAQEDPEIIDGILLRAMEWHDEGKIRPIEPVTVFPASKIVDSFRYMQQGVHMGRILIEFPVDITGIPLLSHEVPIAFPKHASYLLVGGLGGLGRAISTWMAENGASNLVYLSRSAGKSQEDQAFLRELEVQGCHATCVRGDVADAGDVAKAVAQCSAPLRGVLQMSLALRDSTFAKMSYDEWRSALAPKVQGTWNLHHAVQKESLDFFVLFSSLSGICGNTGQANYAAANTFLDAFVRYRQKLNLPCSGIALGPVEDIGLVSREEIYQQNFRRASARVLREAEVIEGLSLALRCRGASEDKIGVSAPIILGLGNTKPLSHPEVRPFWTPDIRYGMYRNMEAEAEIGATVSDSLKSFLARIEQDPSLLNEPETEIEIRKELGKLVTQHMINADKMDDEQIAETPIDSLMAIEIRGWVRRNLRLEVGLPAISKAGTVRGLATVIMTQLRVKYMVAELAGKQESNGNNS